MLLLRGTDKKIVGTGCHRHSLLSAVPQEELTSRRGKVYIASKGLTHNDHLLGYLMPLDSDKKIGKLKDIAIGRCRERIELAACKAKELMNKPVPEGQQMIDRGI